MEIPKKKNANLADTFNEYQVKNIDMLRFATCVTGTKVSIM